MSAAKHDFAAFEFVEQEIPGRGITSILAHPLKHSAKPGRRPVAAGVNLRVTPERVILEAISTQEPFRLQGLATELHRRAVEFAHARGLRLEGTTRRKPELNSVWDKLRAQREQMEVETTLSAPGSIFDAVIKTLPETEPAPPGEGRDDVSESSSAE